MKIPKNFSRLLAMVLALTLVVSILPMQASGAVVGEVVNGSTGLTGGIDTSDTISLPIEILDYKADGMLFEYAMNYGEITAADFGATWYESYTTRTSLGGTFYSGNYWGCLSNYSLQTSNAYAKYMRANFAANPGAEHRNWAQGRAGVVLADFGENPGAQYTTDNLRYMVIVYRTNNTAETNAFSVGVSRTELNSATDANNCTGNIYMNVKNANDWNATVLDLKSGGLGSHWTSEYGRVCGVFVGLPIWGGHWFDLAHVAFFKDETQANKFADYALTDGSDRGDHTSFSLLRGSHKDSVDGVGYRNEEGIHKVTDTVGRLEWTTETVTYDNTSEAIKKIGYDLYFKFTGIATVGLLESTLGRGEKQDDVLPVYKQEVVEYVASLLKEALEIPERNAQGWKNYRYIRGEPSAVYGGVDLATALRSRISGELGTYAASKTKKLVGTWAEVEGNIKTYMDAAYFLLNSIFVPGSYNEPQSNFQKLILSRAFDTTSKSYSYVFDAGFVSTDTPTASTRPAIDYYKDSRTPDTIHDGFIINTSAAGKAMWYYEADNTTTLNPFLPVGGTQTNSQYYQDDGAASPNEGLNSLKGRNFNYVIKSHGDFIYDPDDELFFNFEGDDDVYLFINNELVLDIGAAHSLDTVRINVNDYVDAAWAKVNAGTATERDRRLALEEGRTYSFDFFYMERHSYGANMRINTNIRLIDPTMQTEKKAWQNGTEINYGGIVNKDQIVEYGFALTNTGAERLFNFAFTDSDIGVSLSSEEGLKVTGANVTDLSGGKLEASDLTAYLSGYVDWANPTDGWPDTPTETIAVKFKDNNELKEFLADMKAAGTDQTNAGLWPFSTVEIRGIGYKLTTDQAKSGFFDNRVISRATNETQSKRLDGDARMRVCIPSDPMYYQWANHKLEVYTATLVTDILEAASQSGNTLEGKVTDLRTDNVNAWFISDRMGNKVTLPDNSPIWLTGGTLHICYTTPGTNVFYMTLVYNNNTNRVTVPVLANVTDVVDSVFVLDYGLMAELTKDNALTKNDTLTVPGRDTQWELLYIGSGGEWNSSLNRIKFNQSNSGKMTVENGKGEFTLTGQTLRYMPDKFMDQVETIQVALTVWEGDSHSALAAPQNINREVQMYKNVSVLPATVVYYEDNFPGIKYLDVSDSGVTKVVNTFTEITGTGSNPYYNENYNQDPYYGGSQSVDQDQEYGQDKIYQNPENDDDSGKSCHTIVIRDANQFATFEFTGTGFELIARTTSACKSATIVLTVTDDKGEVVKRIPVITEYDNVEGANESIYQVPVIRVDGLEKATYTVAINGVPAYDYNKPVDDWYEMIDSYFYLDGIRIFQPMGSSNENYNDNENGATFAEIRDLIIEGMAAAAKYDGASMTVSTGTTTWTENYLGVDSGLDDGKQTEYTGESDNIEDYMLFGPNNEVYMNGDLSDSSLVFYVKKTEGAKVHNVQIAVRAMDPLQFFGVATSPEGGISAEIEYGVGNDAWTPLVTVASSTEQYFTIDLNNCPVTSDGRIQVVVRVKSGMVSFTTLKYNGVTLAAVNEKPTVLRYQNGVLVTPGENGEYVPVTETNYPAFAMLSSQVRSTQVSEIKESEPEVTEPEVPLTEAEKKQNLISNLKESADYAKELAGQNNET